ncbi:MAG TPA: SIMPL domain-containing protein [Candidatus Aquilonibacter sp.]|nr:SIMPL domain-containing protein [Candidatus Aquilonibacter sp.]
MKRVFALMLFAALAPATPASAQIHPPVSIGPPGGPVTARNHGITVYATGVSNVAADEATINLQISSADNRLTLTRASLQPVIDALVKAGADPASVRLPLSAGAAPTNMTQLTATVTHPTVDEMKRGIITVGAAIAPLTSIQLRGAMVALRTNACADAAAKARTIAIASARKKAAAIASEVGVHLGSVVDVTANESSPDGSCSTQYYVSPDGPQFNTAYGAPASDESYVMIPVRAFLTITYAIK